jgi:hypothetical protein
VPPVNELPDTTKYEYKPSVYIKMERCKTSVLGSFCPGKGVVSSVTKKSNLFSDYTFDGLLVSEMDYTISIKISDNSSGPGPFFMLTALTLFIVPDKSTRTISMDAVIIDNHTGMILKEYDYRELIDMYFSILAFPAFFNSLTAPDRTKNNMVKTLYKDILEDEILNYR